MGGSLPADSEAAGTEMHDPRAEFLQCLQLQMPEESLVVSCRVSDYNQIGRKVLLPGAITLLPLPEALAVASWWDQVVLGRHAIFERKPDAFLSFAQELDLLEVSPTVEDVEFPHLAFRDFFVARALKPILLHEHGDAAAEAAGGLAAIGYADPEMVPALIHLLGDRNVGRRYSAVLLLSKLGASAGPAALALVRTMLVKDGNLGIRATEAFSGIGEAAVPELLPLLNDGDARIRGAAAKALGKVGPPARAAFPALIEMFLNDSEVRDSAGLAISAIGAEVSGEAPASVTAFDGAHLDSNASIASPDKATCVPAWAVPSLLKVLEDMDSWMRSLAARALGKVRPPPQLCAVPV